MVSVPAIVSRTPRAFGAGKRPTGSGRNAHGTVRPAVVNRGSPTHNEPVTAFWADWDMPIYFEMKSETQPLASRANADALSEILQDALHDLNVRVVSIRKAPDRGYVYACAARRRPVPGDIRRRLSSDKRLRKFDFSAEAESADGPFEWA